MFQSYTPGRVLISGADALATQSAVTSAELLLLSGLTGIVSSVTGTANRVTSSGGANPVIDISASYVGQPSITTVGALTSGSIGAGFTAIANSSLANSSITINGTSISLGGSATITAAIPNALSVDNSSLQLNSGTTFDGSAARTISVKAGGVTNAMLVNSSVTIGSTAVTLGTAVTTFFGLTSINGFAITANTGVVTAGIWNGTVVGVTYGGTGTATQFTSGSIIFAGTSGVYNQDNTMFFWDDTNNIFYVGANSGAFTNSKAHFEGNVNSYSQINSINKSAGNSASTDFIATADTGTDSINYVDLGTNSSTYNDVSYTITGVLDSYLYCNGGNLAVGTQTAAKSIYFHTGGTLLANKRVTIADASVTFHAYGAGVLQTNGSGLISSTTVPDASLATPYIKADGTRALTGAWGAGAFSITANSIILGNTANELAMGSSASQASSISSTTNATKGIISFDSFFNINGTSKTIGINTAAASNQPITSASASVNVNVVSVFTNSFAGNASRSTLRVTASGNFEFSKYSSAWVTSGLISAALARLTASTGDILIDTQTSANIYFAINGTTTAQLGISASSLTVADAVNFVLNATTGTKIATATTQKLSFWNATPIIQPASANQAALTNSTGGAYDGTLVDVGIAFSQANINNNFTDVYTVINEMRNVLVNTGLMKGAA